MHGIPLSYVIKESDAPDRVGPYTDFTEECVACITLTGVSYDDNCSKVHQSLVSFTTGQPLEDWIKYINWHTYGRKSMTVLRAHFSGEGNAIRMITKADRFKDTLNYKNERSLPFFV